MTAETFANTAVSTLAASILAADTSLSLHSGDGAGFPATSGGAFRLVIGDDTTAGAYEIVLVGTRASDACSSVTRAQESTTAQNWPISTPVKCDFTAGSAAAMWTDITAKVAKAGDTMTGTLELDATLGGSTKTLLRLKATDGKTYEFQMLTDGSVILQNTTDSVRVFRINSTGKVGFGAVETATYAFVDHDTTNHWTIFETPQAGSNHEIARILGWDSAAQTNLAQFGGTAKISGALLWLAESGNLTIASDLIVGKLLPTSSIVEHPSGAPPTLTNGSTITTSTIGMARVSNGGAVTGIIMGAGATNGQRCAVVNEGSGNVTMATAATSNVADGTSCVIAPNQVMWFIWNTGTSRWHHQ